jgi:hypothetical protein
MTTRVLLKNFNTDLLFEQLAGLPISGITWIGFVPLDTDRYMPGLVNSGEMDLSSTRPLSTDEESQLDSILLLHNATQRTAEQTRRVQDDSDLDRLTLDFSNWGTLTQQEKLEALRKTVRVLLRFARGSTV